MDKELQNFIDKAKGIKMLQKEKLSLRAKLSSLPIPSPLGMVRSPYLSKSHISTLGKALVAACLIVILGGGSLSYAAENSLPGDTLYQVKTEFNEEIISAIKFTPEAEITWQEKRLEKRMREIDELKKRNRLDDRAKIQIERNFERQIKKVEGLKIKTKTGPKERVGEMRKK